MFSKLYFPSGANSPVRKKTDVSPSPKSHTDREEKGSFKKENTWVSSQNIKMFSLGIETKKIVKNFSELYIDYPLYPHPHPSPIVFFFLNLAVLC